MRPIPSSIHAKKRMESTRQQGTQLELDLRRLLWISGIRGYRLNYSGLVGRPDIVFTRWKVVIFANGCFWHGCRKCNRSSPLSNREFWINKIERNVQRDQELAKKLMDLGFQVLTLWECEVTNEPARVVERVRFALTSQGWEG